MAFARLAEELRQDLRYGFRLVRANPGFTAAAVLSLALGIAANTSIFTLVDQVLLRLLPVENPRQLVQFRMEGGRFGNQNGDGLHTFSYPLYVAFRDKNTVFSGLTGQVTAPVSLVSGDRGQVVDSGWVSGNFFQVLGVKPHIGRLLTVEDDRPSDGAPVVVLQYDFWQARYEGRQDVIGSTIRLNGAPFTIVGVAAQEFEGTNPGLLTQLWAPVNARNALIPDWRDTLENERSAWFYLFARLKPGFTLDQAQAEMRLVHDQQKREELRGEFFAKFPDNTDRFLRQTMTLIPASRGMSAIRRNFEQPLIVLQWLVGMVLLIACTNVAGLLLAQASARQREIAIRSALGARRAQVVRQLFVESSMLALAGGVAGLFLSVWLTRGLVRFLPYNQEVMSLSTTPDARILLFTTVVTLITAFAFGLLPAFRGSNIPASAVLKDGAGSVTGNREHVRLRKAFVALQVSASLVLLIGAGLFVRTLDNLRHVDLGFTTDNVVMFAVSPATRYEPARKLQLYRTLMESLGTVPGVRAVGANTTRLLTGGRWDSGITITPTTPINERVPVSFFNAVTPGYFEALGIPVTMGRDFSWNDWGGSRMLALVNQSLATRYFSGTQAVGQRLGQGRAVPMNIEIIGVFGNARYHDVRGEIPVQTFVNMDSRIDLVNAINVYARIQGDPRAIMPLLRQQVGRVDSDLVISEMRMMDEQVNRRLANERMLSFLSAGFAVLATILAVIGLHGVLAFVVARRTREIGIRVALGAQRHGVVRLVVREMLMMILLGIVTGTAAAYLAGSYVETQLFGVKASEWSVFAVGVLTLLTAALVASLAPALRASRIDPMRALRQE
jgi:predicted permease